MSPFDLISNKLQFFLFQVLIIRVVYVNSENLILIERIVDCHCVELYLAWNNTELLTASTILIHHSGEDLVFLGFSDHFDLSE